MKKILIIAPAYYPSLGGVENHIRSVARQLKISQIQPIILVRYGRYLPSKQIVDQIKVYRLPKHDNFLSFFVWSQCHKGVFRNITTIHSHDYYPRALRRILPTVQWVHTFHGYEGYPLDPVAIKSRQTVRTEVGWCTCVGEFIEKWYGTPCDYVTYGAVDPKRFSKPLAKKPKWDFVFWGRLEKDTGFENYLRAFALISKHSPSFKLLVIGDGSLLVWANNFVTKSNLSVEILGDQVEVENYLRFARVAFVSGYLGILEAALVGLPIIAYYGNLLKKDYLQTHPMAQYMYIVDSTKNIAEAAQKALLENEAETKLIQDWARQQTWEKIADEYARHYKLGKR